MICATEALGVDLVDVFGTRRAGSEPGRVGDHLETADLGAIGTSEEIGSVVAALLEPEGLGFGSLAKGLIPGS